MTRPATLLLLLATASASGCGGRAGGTIPSPDGALALHTRIEEGGADPGARGCVVFEIRDAAGKTLHVENTRASHRMRWRMGWESDDAIRLESSDIGGWTWRKQPDGSWKKVLPLGHFDPEG